MVFLFAVSFVSANTYVVGKTNDNLNPPKELSGVTVTIDCGATNKFTTSLSDASYGIGLNDSEANCSEATINFKVGGYESQTVKIDPLSGVSVGIDNYLIINSKLVKETNSGSSGSSSSGSSGGGSRGSPAGYKYYNCGNGFCDAGEDITLCPQDCGEDEMEENETEDEGFSGIDEENTGEEEDIENTGLQKITGAAVGLFKDNPASAVALIILIILVIGAFALKGKKPEEEETTVKKKK